MVNLRSGKKRSSKGNTGMIGGKGNGQQVPTFHIKWKPETALRKGGTENGGAGSTKVVIKLATHEFQMAKKCQKSNAPKFPWSRSIQFVKQKKLSPLGEGKTTERIHGLNRKKKTTKTPKTQPPNPMTGIAR